MKFYAVVAILIFVALSASSVSIGATPQPEQFGAPTSYSESVAALRRDLLTAFRSKRESVRLYYSTNCHADPDAAPPFPRITLRSPSPKLTGLSAVRDIFLSDPNVVVTEGPSGVIRINIGAVPKSILGTRIPELHLRLNDQYDPNLAVDALLSAREVRAAMAEQGLRPTPVLYEQGIQPPTNGLPHLPSVIQNMTVDEILDLTARTFGGLVTYGICTQASAKRHVLISFEYLEAQR